MTYLARARCHGQLSEEQASALCRAIEPVDDAAPEWIQLLPLGPSIEGRDGRHFRLSDPESVIAMFDGDLPVDWEHATELKATKGDEAPAAGWIRELEIVRNAAGDRAPGIWGRVEWTERGQRSVASREYRFTSPVFLHDRAKNVLKITSAALTNRPNLRMKALNRGVGPGRTKENGMNEEELKALRKALGLPEDADAESILRAANSRQPKETRTNLEDVVPRADHQLALNRIKELEGRIEARERAEFDKAVNSLLDEAVKGGKIAPASVDFWKSRCRSEEDLEEVRSYLAGQPRVAADDDTRGDNRSKEKPAAVAALNAEQLSVLKALGKGEDEYAQAHAALYGQGGE